MLNSKPKYEQWEKIQIAQLKSDLGDNLDKAEALKIQLISSLEYYEHAFRIAHKTPPASSPQEQGWTTRDIQHILEKLEQLERSITILHLAYFEDISFVNFLYVP